MAIESITNFIDTIVKHHLISQELLKSINAPTFSSPQDLVKDLVKRDWLSPYQVNQIFNGRAADLLLGSYVLVERLGEGGMGAVFKARNWKLDRIVALKLIRKQHLTSREAVKRFQREIRAAAQLKHPHIVHTLDADEVNGTHFMVMEFASGNDLAKLVRQQGPLPVHQACIYIRQAALGLQHAHERGMVHRDIKPHNLIVTSGARGDKEKGRQGEGEIEIVKILDMGLARMEIASDESATLTQEGMVMGTPDYIAPEQAMDAHGVDIRADVYSLGCTLYFLLTGKPPFPGGETMDKLIRHQTEQPVPIEMIRPEVDERVTDIVYRMMAKKPDERFQTPAEVAEALTNWESAAPLAAKRTAPAPVANPFANLESNSEVAPQPNETKVDAQRKLPWLPIAGSVAAIACAVVLVIVVMRLGSTGDAEPPPKGKDIAKAKEKRPVKPPAKKETPPPLKKFPPGPVTDEWVAYVQSLPPDDQAKMVFAKLAELNPRYHANLNNYAVQNNAVVTLNFNGLEVNDISPVRALSKLQKLHCNTGRGAVRITDLSPLRGMRLTSLQINGHRIKDLTPLADMPLGFLYVADNPVEDLSPIKGMPVHSLDLGRTDVRDLGPLKDCKSLGTLNLADTFVEDLSPLAVLPLRSLNLAGSPVKDLTPLKWMPIQTLDLTATKLTDLSPLRGMELETLNILGAPLQSIEPLKTVMVKNLNFNYFPKRDRDILRGFKSLESINGQPVAEFWRIVEPDPKMAAWIRDVAKLAPAEQMKMVAEKLKASNPGQEVMPEFKEEGGAITQLTLSKCMLADISPLAALTRLKTLSIRGSRNLWPLSNLPLESLRVDNCLAMDMSPLRSMPLRDLQFVYHNYFRELSPLASCQLRTLRVDAATSSLESLRDHPIENLHCRFAGRDLSPLKNTALKSIHLGFVDRFQGDGLRAIKTLEKINTKPVAEFWKDHGEQEIEFVRRELIRLNPGFEGKIEFKHDRGVITKASINGVIVDLNPIRHFSKLTEFGVGGGKLQDLSPLKGLPLGRLFLAHTNVHDLSPLKGMPLTTLTLTNTKVTDLSPLTGMPLNVLTINGTLVKDLSPLKGMQLKYFNCGNSKVCELSVLQGMPLVRYDGPFSRWRDTDILRSIKTLEKINGKPAAEFWKEVDAEKAAFDAWEAKTRKLPPNEMVAAVAAKMKELNPGFNSEFSKIPQAFRITGPGVEKVTDLSPLRALSKLYRIGVFGASNLTDLWPLRDVKLKILELKDTRISDLRPLKGMPLKHLSVRMCTVSDLSPLWGAPLDSLILQNIQASDLTALANSPLRSISIQVAPVSNLSPLRGMKLNELTLIHLKGVTDITPLQGMPLTTLDIGNCSIKDLSPLKGMPLEKLSCGANPVSDLSPLVGMKLTSLNINATQVTDLSPLKNMPLKRFIGPFVPWRDSRILRSIKTLEKVNNKPAKEAHAWADWEDRVRAMKAEDQVKAVAEKLKELNPGFKGEIGTDIKAVIRQEKVGRIGCVTDFIVDISPFRAFSDLTRLELTATSGSDSKLADLWPLHGMKLNQLVLHTSKVSELRPLSGMPLKMLLLANSPVTDLSSLQGLQLEQLALSAIAVRDLSPLRNMPLKSLQIGSAKHHVSDLNGTAARFGSASARTADAHTHPCVKKLPPVMPSGIFLLSWGLP